MSFLTKIFGTKSSREIKKISPIIQDINSIYDTLNDKNEDYLVKRTKELRNEVIKKISEQEIKQLENLEDKKEIQKIRKEIENNILSDILPEAFALVKHGNSFLNSSPNTARLNLDPLCDN